MSTHSIRERIASWISPKTSGTQWFLNWAQLAAQEDSGAGTVTTDSAYKMIAWVNIAVSARARTLARAPFQLYNGDDLVESGNVWDLFNAGLQGKSRYQLWEATEGWRCLRGEAVWILGWGGVTGFPKQIVIVDPATMEVKIDKATLQPTLWTFNDGQVKIPFKPEEIIHFPTWNPFDPVRGLSEIQPLRDEVSQEFLTSRAMTNLLTNSSIPGGVITVPGDEMSAEDAQAMIERWEAKHKGVNRAGRVAVLGSGATYQRISLTPEEAQSLESRQWNRETILAKLGVPRAAAMLQSEGGTLSGKDTEEQMRSFWQFTLIPEIKYFEDKLQKDFFQRFGLENMRGEFDLDSIAELQVNDEEMHNRLRMDVQAGLLTINEAREQMGMDAVEWGDTWWKPLGLSDVKEEPEPQTYMNPPPLTPEEETQAEGEKPPEEDEEEDKPKKSIASMFVSKGRPKIYTPTYRQAHWKAVIGPWERIEGQYTKKLKSWVYSIRSDELEKLHKLMARGNFAETLRAGGSDLLLGDPMWHQSEAKLRDISKPFFIKAVELTGGELGKLFRDMGLEVGGSWTIWDTRAKELLEFRVNQGSLNDIPKTVQDRLRSVIGDALEGGWTEQELTDVIESGFRKQFNITQARCQYIARTELGGAINDSRIEGFKDVGLQRHEWLSAQDERVRDSHQIDGEVVTIGERFSNGLLYPNDPGGPAEEVINCRCLTLPVFEE
jgi:HK97 family phage portal protein